MLLLTPVDSPADHQGPMGHWHWALTDDNRTVSRHGLCASGEWPVQTDAALVVPAWRLSWHSVSLPKIGAARLRAVLDGLLEEHLLDDPTQMHLALAPGARAGQAAPVWVAAVHRQWLLQCLQALQAAGLTITRLLPASAPQANPTLHVTARDDGLWWQASGPDGVLTLTTDSQASAPPPLLQPWLSAQTADDGAPAIQASADAPGLGPAERLWPELRWQVQPTQATALQALQQGWDLAQFDLRLADQRSLGRRLLRVLRSLAREPQWRPMRWGLAGLAAIQLVGLNALAWQERHALREQQAEMHRLLTTTFPQVSLVIDAPAQMQRELDRLRQGQGALGTGDLESLLHTLASRDRAPALQRLDYASDHVKWSGWAPAAAQRAELEADLRGQGWTASGGDGQWQLHRETRP